MAPNFTKEYTVGRREIVKNTQLLVLSENEELFSMLDFTDDNVFLNPFIFSYFHQQHWATDGTKGPFIDPKITLQQVLFHSVEKSKMPAEYAFPVYSDETGTVYVPYTGYFKSAVKGAMANLCYSRKAGTFDLYQGNRKVDHHFIPSCFIPGTKIELHAFTNPFFNNVFENAFAGFNRGKEDKDRSNLQNTPVTALAGVNNAKINTAFSIIRDSGLNYYPLLADGIRGIFNFSNRVIWSFAHKAAYGVSFLSGDENDSPIFFAAELMHQGGHTVFAAILNKLDRFIAIDPTTLMCEVSGNASDLRTIENAIHGMYTTSKVAEIMDYLYQQQDRLKLTSDQRHEVIGRLADNYYRHKTGLHTADVKKIFTKKGLSIYTSLDHYLTRVYNKYGNLTNRFRYEKGDFVFNYRKFKERFPLTRA